MFNNHNVVVCIPAGRERYLRILIPYLLKHGTIIDHFNFWVNTNVQSDICYIESLIKIDNRIKLVYNTNVIATYNSRADQIQFNNSINEFYVHCIDDDTIYFKIDDDICYIHENFFEKMCTEKLDNADTFLVLANMLNCSHTSKIYQNAGVVSRDHGTCDGTTRCSAGFFSGHFAKHLHETFLNVQLSGDIDKFMFKSCNVPAQHQRIGAICFAGRDFAKFSKFQHSDEAYISTDIPLALKKMNRFCGNAFVCHFAFSHQRVVAENSNLLERYYELSQKICA